MLSFIVLLLLIIFLPSDISVMSDIDLSSIIVAENITRFQVWVPDCSGRITTLRLKQTSNSRVGQFVHPAEMTLHVVGECVNGDYCRYSCIQTTQHNNEKREKIASGDVHVLCTHDTCIYIYIYMYMCTGL